MRATIPAARGAAADVPVWPSVQPVPRCMDQSDVTCRDTDFQIDVQYIKVVKSSGRGPNTNTQSAPFQVTGNTHFIGRNETKLFKF